MEGQTRPARIEPLSVKPPSVKLSPGPAIRDIETALPSTVVATDDLVTDMAPAEAALLRRHTGVSRRHVALPQETALDLAEQACRRLLCRHEGLSSRLDVLVFCTQTPDHPLPPNSCILHGRLGLSDRVMAFDIPHACSAFVYALQIVRSLLVSGAGSNALVVTADTYSRLIHPRDRSARLLFGDGAAATWLAPQGERGIVDVACGTLGAGHKHFIVPAGGARQPLSERLLSEETIDSSGNARTPGQIHMNGREILSFTGSRIPPEVRRLLERNGLKISDIDHFVFHQASAVVLDTLTRLLAIEPARVVRDLDTVGNTVSASIPIALGRAMADGRIEPGQRLVLCGFGAGLSWGTALIEW
jgi:3-oxoacyl-[acyl-carrier-protein] synthase-3